MAKRRADKVNEFSKIMSAKLFLKTLLLAAAVLGVAGCGNQDSRRIPVEGTITYRGEPVAYGAIALRPAPDTSGPAAGTEIINGKYEIPQRAGPATGSYLARISIVGPNRGDDGRPLGAKAGGEIMSLEAPVEIVAEPKEYNFTLVPADHRRRRQRR